jgi:hypothetical protein
VTTLYDTQVKFFTDVVSKKQMKAIIQTVLQRIEGTVYIMPTRRLLDELNQAEEFIAVTDASISGFDIQQPVDFMAVRVDQIVWIVLLDEA